MQQQNILFAFGLTLIAGLSTGIGSGLSIFTKKTNTKFFSIALGFSAGVMIYISLVDILTEARLSLIGVYGDVAGPWVTAAAFFGGVFLIAAIDRLVPSEENPHEVKMIEDMECDGNHPCRKKLLRTGIFTALAIAIHNFPEGLVTFTSAVKEPRLGIAIAIAVAIHNIPEGIAVSVPVYAATGKKMKAFWLSFVSGLSEPLGAVIGFIFLRTFSSDAVFGLLFAAVAGIMVFISLDELLPASREYGEAHLSIYGVIGGMALMAVSLLLFI